MTEPETVRRTGISARATGLIGFPFFFLFYPFSRDPAEEGMASGISIIADRKEALPLRITPDEAETVQAKFGMGR